MADRILFLTHKMVQGFGVAVVVDSLARFLQKLGVEVEVACVEHDGKLVEDYPVHVIEPVADLINQLVVENRYTHVIAHTSPFFEMLPQLVADSQRWVWEHGDPTPELFPFDGAERKKIGDHKRCSVYPVVHKVIAISDFIRSDIGWPDAEVIYNGHEHIDAEIVERPITGKFQVGTLMRLGAGEAFYKGNKLFVQLVDFLSEASDDLEFHLMGRGTEEDAEPFRERGITVHLNASDEERARYLASLDIFVSMSLWEGFNLPLLEASVSGALPFALDTGAHPEVTPYVFSNVPEMAATISGMAAGERAFVHAQADMTRNILKEKFSWSNAAKQLFVRL